MFQTLYPDKWFDSPVDGDPQPGDPLPPFHMDQSGTPWTADDTKDWTKYNYTYDVLMPPPTTSAFRVLRAVPVNLPAVNPPAANPPAVHPPAANPPATNPPAAGHSNPEPREEPQNPGSGGNVPDDAVLTHLKQYINSKYGQTRQAVRDSPQIKGNHNDYIINVIYDP
jgi:hypothetical protein